MGKGRKPQAAKVIDGRFGAPAGGIAAPSSERPESPSDLTPAEVEVFEELVARLEEQGRASASHTQIIALAAQRKVEIGRLTALIRTHGEVYVKGAGNDVLDDEDGAEGAAGEFFIKPNPAVKMRSEAMRHLHALLAELGLTPVANTKVGGEAKPQAQNRFTAAGLGRK